MTVPEVLTVMDLGNPHDCENQLIKAAAVVETDHTEVGLSFCGTP